MGIITRYYSLWLNFAFLCGGMQVECSIDVVDEQVEGLKVIREQIVEYIGVRLHSCCALVDRG